MEESKELMKHLDDYNKIILDLNAVGVKEYKHFVDTMMYGKQGLNMNEVKFALNFKELQRNESSIEPSGEGLNVRGRPKERDSKKTITKYRSKSRNPGSNFRFNKCKKEGHFKRDWPERRNKHSEK